MTAVDAGEILGVLRHHFEDVIRRSGHQVAFQNIGDQCNFPLERVQNLVGLAAECNLDKHRRRRPTRRGSSRAT